MSSRKKLVKKPIPSPQPMGEIIGETITVEDEKESAKDVEPVQVKEASILTDESLVMVEVLIGTLRFEQGIFQKDARFQVPLGRAKAMGSAVKIIL